jgi:putative transposase
MKTSTMMTNTMPSAPVGKAWEEVSASFDRFCLAAGIETPGTMMEADAEEACGPRHSRSEDRRGHRWGRTRGKIGFHAGKVVIERRRVRGLNGKELPLASWEQAIDEDWLGQWAMNLMLINVSTRKFRRAGTIARGRRSGAGGERSFGVGRLAPLRRALGRTHAGVDGL